MAIKNLRFYLVILITAIAGLVLDQLTKIWVVATVTPYDVKELIGSVLRVALVYNERGIMGLNLGSPVGYYILPVIGIAIVIYFAIKNKGLFYSLSFGFILAGAFGNLIDRIRLGKVIDFIDMGIGRYRWFTYNLADAFLIFGIVILLIVETKKDFLRQRMAAKPGEEKEKHDEKSLP